MAFLEAQIMVSGFLLLSSLLPQADDEIVASRLFVATSAGVYMSTNWGEDFLPIEPDLPGSIRTFACMGPWAFAGGADGLFLSEDFGKTWKPVASWMGGEVATILPSSYFAVDPVVYVGTREGLYRSSDGGRQWQRLGADLITGAVHGLSWPGPSLFVATSRGLFRSDDSGDRWSPPTARLPDAPLLSLSLSRYFGRDPVAFFGTDGVGLYRTRDGGESFEAVGGSDWVKRRVYSLFWWGTTLLAGTDAGLFLSHDAGESWELAAAELDGTQVYTILVPAAESQSGSDVLLGTERGIFKSSDGALSWRHLKDLGDSEVFAFGSFPVPPDVTNDQR